MCLRFFVLALFVALSGCATTPPSTELPPSVEQMAGRASFARFVGTRIDDDEAFQKYAVLSRVDRSSELGHLYRRDAPDLVYVQRYASEETTEFVETELDKLLALYCPRHGGGKVTAVDISDNKTGFGCETPDGDKIVAAYYLHVDKYRGKWGKSNYLYIFSSREAHSVTVTRKRAEQEAAEVKRKQEYEARGRRLVELREKARTPSGKPLPVQIGILTNEFMQDFYVAGSRHYGELTRTGNERRLWVARQVWADLKYGYGAAGPEAAYVGAEVAFEER